MNELDRKIREALPPNEAELLGPLDEPSVWEQVKQLFQGRLRWASALVVIGGVAFTVFMVVSAVCFFRAEGVREMLAWAGGFGLSLIAVSFSRLWFWLLLHRNAVVREVKRVELLVARLSGRLKMPT
jgi:cytochrome b561